MLLTNRSSVRPRCIFVPGIRLLVALAVGTVGIGLSMVRSPEGSYGVGLLVVGAMIWLGLGVRRIERNGDRVWIMAGFGRQAVPAAGCSIGVVQGRSGVPHVDVVLRVPSEEPRRLARLTLGGRGQAPALARRMAEVLDLPVDEGSTRD